VKEFQFVPAPVAVKNLAEAPPGVVVEWGPGPIMALPLPS